jgi:hypothetical protein
MKALVGILLKLSLNALLPSTNFAKISKVIKELTSN